MLASIKSYGAIVAGLTSLLIAGGLFFWGLEKTSVIIESKESKNQDMQPVYNEVRWLPGTQQDVWMMNQSHHGSQAKADQWERLAIVIDKTKKPFQARFYQLTSGPLVWSEDLVSQRTGYRASCFICHNNGPRAIRPAEDSHFARLSWRDRLKIGVWNLRIKTYGRIQYSELHDQDQLEVPFRHNGQSDNRELTVKTCKICHKEEGLFARGTLRRQQVGTIRNLVESGEMPPLGFQLSDKERIQLEDFLRGF